MLGLVEEERFVELLDIVRAGDRAAVFPFVQALLDEGYDLAEFVQGLGDTLRAVLALRLNPESDPAELSAESRKTLAESGQRFTEEELLRLLVATADFESAGRFRRSAQPRIQVEVLLLRLASLDSSVELRGAPGSPGRRREEAGATLSAGRRPVRATALRADGSPPDARARAENRTPSGLRVVNRKPLILPGPATSRHSPRNLRRRLPRSPLAGPRSVDLPTVWADALEAARGSAPRRPARRTPRGHRGRILGRRAGSGSSTWPRWRPGELSR